MVYLMAGFTVFGRKYYDTALLVGRDSLLLQHRTVSLRGGWPSSPTRYNARVNGDLQAPVLAARRRLPQSGPFSCQDNPNFMPAHRDCRRYIVVTISDPDMSNTGNWHGPFKKRLSAFIDGAARTHEGDVEGLHQTRVASRRLRELVPLMGLERQMARKLDKRLGKVRKRLGKVRELDVLANLISELRQDGDGLAPALRELEADVVKRRTAARERLASKLPLAKLEALASRLRRIAKRRDANHTNRNRSSARGPKNPWLLALEARAARRATSLRSAIDVAGAIYAPKRLHNARVALKELRYSAELLAEARKGPSSGDMETLKAAQDVLGRLRDREVLIERIRLLQTELSRSNLDAVRQLELLERMLEDDCRRIHARYMHDRLKLLAVADRVGGVKVESTPASRRLVS